MADTTHTIGSTGIVKKLVDLGDDTYADAVVSCGRAPSTETVVAGTTSTLGKIVSVTDTEDIYVAQAATAGRNIAWRVQADQLHKVQLYKARSRVDSVTITLAEANRVDAARTFVLNGVTFTSNATLTSCLRSTHTWKQGGADADADCVELAAAINPGHYITCTSVAHETFIINGLTFTGADAQVLATRSFDHDGTDATTATSLAACINAKGYFTCATAVAGDHVVVGSVTYTGKTGAEDTATHYFSVDTSNDATATSLAACINADTATHGFTALAATTTVTLTATTAAASASTVTGHAVTVVYTPAYGVPGVTATGRGKEVSLVSDWDADITCTGTAITSGTGVFGHFGVPGVTATALVHVITIVPHQTPSSTGPASTIYGTAASDAAEIAISQAATLAGLIKDGALNDDVAINSTTAGTLYEQTMNGWEYGYIGVNAHHAGGTATTVTVGASLH